MVLGGLGIPAAPTTPLPLGAVGLGCSGIHGLPTHPSQPSKKMPGLRSSHPGRHRSYLRATRAPTSGKLSQGSSTTSAALRNTASNISSVSFPVKVFCWLGW